MPIFRLGREVAFPHPEESDPSGLLAVGGDLSPERLLLAYASGIFPWYSEDQPILWHSPDPRSVLRPELLHVPRSLARTIRRGRFEVRLDTAFEVGECVLHVGVRESPAGRELRCERVMGLIGLGDDHEPARVLVETMHDAGPRHAADA